MKQAEIPPPKKNARANVWIVPFCHNTRQALSGQLWKRKIYKKKSTFLKRLMKLSGLSLWCQSDSASWASENTQKKKKIDAFSISSRPLTYYLGLFSIDFSWQTGYEGCFSSISLTCRWSQMTSNRDGTNSYDYNNVPRGSPFKFHLSICWHIYEWKLRICNMYVPQGIN